MTPKELNSFGLYAKDHKISSLNLHRFNTNIESNMTPYVLEERQMNVTQMDVFSRLMLERIIWVAGEVNDHMSTIVQAQLMFLDSLDSTDITIHIDSPGGSVKSGLSMVDVMDYISSDIRTINTGMAASMGSVLLGAGTKGKRGALPNSKTMIHQSSGGFGGELAAAEIQFQEWVKINNKLFNLLGEYTGKDPEQIKKDAIRDLWFDAHEAVEYGIIDEVISKKNK
jgi:ATP-dependent Clp protease protease subunit